VSFLNACKPSMDGFECVTWVRGLYGASVSADLQGTGSDPRHLNGGLIWSLGDFLATVCRGPDWNRNASEARAVCHARKDTEETIVAESPLFSHLSYAPPRPSSNPGKGKVRL
jgi:hypothetical protein